MIEVKACNPTETTIALLYGGKSTEREISLLSGTAVAKGLRDAGFTVEEIDTAEQHYIDRIERLAPDVVFNCLHGRGGEDGCVQGVCVELGLPFTGSGVLASALAMDKPKAKLIYESAGLSTPKSCVVVAGNEPTYSEVAEKLGKKIVVKPAGEGSAFGVSIVEDENSFLESMKIAEELDSEIIIEQYISGTEVTVAVMGNKDLMVFPVLEVVPRGDFYDFESKYSQGGSDHICPARLSDAITAKCQEYALAAHRSLGCRGVSRTDMIIDGDGEPWVLETNTIPGMTETSLIPDVASHIGIGFSELCKLIVDLALEDED